MTPAPSTYTESLLARLADRDPLAVQAELVPALAELAAGMDDAALRRPEAPGKWSVLQVVHHLADNEMVYGYRVRMILTHDAPAMERYDREAWVARLGDHDAPLPDALAELGAFRARNLRLWRSLDEAALERVGVHGDRGPESLRTIRSLLAGHDLLHRAQVARIRAAVGV